MNDCEKKRKTHILSYFIFGIYKRYLIIDQQIAQHFVNYSDCLHTPLPFYETQIHN